MKNVDGCCTLQSQAIVISVFLLCLASLNVLHIFYLKIMTAVTSHQSFPEMIKEIPPGHVKDLVLQLCGQTHRWVNLFLTHHSAHLFCVRCLTNCRASNFYTSL